LYVTDPRGLAAPWSLALNRFGNFYAVDSGFEGRVDNSGNCACCGSMRRR
jgi:hypothetical protein